MHLTRRKLKLDALASQCGGTGCPGWNCDLWWEMCSNDHCSRVGIGIIWTVHPSIARLCRSGRLACINQSLETQERVSPRWPVRGPLMIIPSPSLPVWIMAPVLSPTNSMKLTNKVLGQYWGWVCQWCQCQARSVLTAQYLGLVSRPGCLTVVPYGVLPLAWTFPWCRSPPPTPPPGPLQSPLIEFWAWWFFIMIALSLSRRASFNCCLVFHLYEYYSLVLI